MVVHEVGAELRVQRLEHIAHGYTELAAVTRIAVGTTAHHHSLFVDVHAPRGEELLRSARHRAAAIEHAQVVGTTIGNDVRLGEEGAAVVDNRLIPFELVEGLGRQVVGEALRDVEHVDGNQAFLDLGPGAAERRHVDGVDRVDAAADEGTFTPAHYLLAKPHRARLIADGVVVVDKGVEQLGAGRLGAFLAVGVADVLELAVFVLQLEVVPVLAAHEHTGVAVLELQVMNAFEDLGEGFALLEVQVAIVGCL